ncbi:MAG: P-loop NTPase [Pseudomonadota bacterium]|nr:P-loop NTPase [Pseudomonadota bacterium]
MTHQPRTLAVTGGKGGIGKTSISLNLALTLAREGHRVLLLDNAATKLRTDCIWSRARST